MASIFDLVTAKSIAAFWAVQPPQNEQPFPGAALFPSNNQIGLNLQWIKGAKGLPVALKPSAFDAHAVPRARVGADILKTQMPYFKESYYIDEETRQKLLMVQGQDQYVDTIMTNIFDDVTNLLRGAAVTREAMRMMALTTGVITVFGNGQNYTFDYGIENKSTVSTPWSDHENSTPIEDIRIAQETIMNKTGAMVTRAMCDGMTWSHLRNNKGIKASLLVATNGVGVVPDDAIKAYLMGVLGIELTVNVGQYKSFDGLAAKYVPDGTFVMYPQGALGSTWFGTTPAQADLMSDMNSNVTIVDQGVAITTAPKYDPVTVDTIVSQVCLPSFEQADNVYILGTL